MSTALAHLLKWFPCLTPPFTTRKCLRGVSLTATLASPIVAALAVFVAIVHYNATEQKRIVETSAARRMLFLNLLHSLSSAHREFHILGEVYRNAKTLGSMQSNLGDQAYSTLLQAEEVLPYLEKEQKVGPHEYLILARASLSQGFDANATKYATLSLTSDNPKVKAGGTAILAELLYMRGSLDDARDKFAEAIAVYDASTKLLAEEQLAGKVQLFVTWSEMETDFGDESYAKARSLIVEGQALCRRLRPGSLRDSGDVFFADQLLTIEKRLKPPEPVPASP